MPPTTLSTQLPREATSAASTSSRSFVTSEPPANTWAQPSASHYVMVVAGSVLKAALISGTPMLTTIVSWQGADSRLELEMRDWDKLSDEALDDFESTLD